MRGWLGTAQWSLAAGPGGSPPPSVPVLTCPGTLLGQLQGPGWEGSSQAQQQVGRALPEGTGTPQGGGCPHPRACGAREGAVRGTQRSHSHGSPQPTGRGWKAPRPLRSTLVPPTGQTQRWPECKESVQAPSGQGQARAWASAPPGGDVGVCGCLPPALTPSGPWGSFNFTVLVKQVALPSCQCAGLVFLLYPPTSFILSLQC